MELAYFYFLFVFACKARIIGFKSCSSRYMYITNLAILTTDCVMVIVNSGHLRTCNTVEVLGGWVSFRPIERNCAANSAVECMEATVTRLRFNLDELLIDNNCDFWQFDTVEVSWITGIPSH